MKPTLVTGANGHVGNNICRLLVERGEPVRAMIRPSADPRPLETLDVEIVRGDILDPASTAAAVAGAGRVYHTAAGFLMWSKDPERDIIRPSVEGTRNVLEAAVKAGVEKVVYTSTTGTMGFAATPDRVIDESHFNEHPHTHYVRGKIAAEKEAFAIAARTGLPLCAMNPGLILGPRFWKVSRVGQAGRRLPQSGRAALLRRRVRRRRRRGRRARLARSRWRRAGAASATSSRART